MRLGRRNGIERIQHRVLRLGERAAGLHEREQRAAERLAAHREAGHARRTARSQRRLERLRAERERLAEREIRAILLLLREQSGRTRQRLDRELERLTPLQEEWERLRGIFSSLDETIAAPALEPLAAQWRGDLEIPDFPVHENQGYVKPFPSCAILF